ncbi:NAD(P)/FAD-dependent oxidoreductase [Phenylobacterium montanum]|uniref:FAD-binding oxidoreductase n=1 Tax=Phenylobacterium montanum TaxID=2823693 RepID=A0A975G018_9CAUL|nr:FAD-binding oxidoreductase [Caulobacter sp. S6]QUD88311.1 FAD-binding oxidoreductase [Caulobacter sp. S6]
MAHFDVLIIGSGMAGASAAFALAGEAKVLVAEREDQHGYHTTGRSAALYSAAYGDANIRALTTASRAFFDAPPAGFCDYPLLSPRGCLYLAAPGDEAALTELADEVRGNGIETHLLDAAEARRRVPILYPGKTTAALAEPSACDIDVNGLHVGFLKGAKAKGADIRLSAEIVELNRSSEGWSVRFRDGETVTAGVVVDAAGAWADQVAELAGAHSVGLAPLRRTALLIEAPEGHDITAWPAVIDILESFYFKPDAGRILASPADETSSAPCDAWPDDMDVAECVDRIQQVADLPVRRVLRSWAGLRTFAPDRSPVIGYDGACDGFFWLAGQGGYGVQTAPAAGRLAAALILGRQVPEDLRAFGVDAAKLAPQRFHQA